MTELRVNVVCRNFNSDRIIPRMARALRDELGWTLSAAPSSEAAGRMPDVIYLSGYFESQRLSPWPECPVMSYFTHREEEPPGNDKAKLFDTVAGMVQLRIATCKLYADYLSAYGPTVQVSAPLERDHFTLGKRSRHRRPVVGFSGYTYKNRRKGEDLARGLAESDMAMRVEWRASGRGWPVTTTGYKWSEMPAFYQGLDVLVCPSRVEGIPMPPLEALACGTSVVVPRGVGLLDELPDVPGIYRFERGDLPSLLEALERAAFPDESADREELRAVTEPYSVENWVRDHERAVEMLSAGDNAGIEADRLNVGTLERQNVNPEIEPVDYGTGSTRGIYCVAFGGPARESCARMMRSAKEHMPDIPIALCAASPIGLEDVLITQPDSDIGGRRAKLKAYELTPAEWDAVLYLDADTEVVNPVYEFFEWVEDGWEMAICKDIAPNDLLGHIKAKVHPPEATETMEVTGTWNVLQLNGGVWSFRRCDAVRTFFRAWCVEWERWAQRDQGALIRALYTHPLKLLLLGSEWNTFPKFQPNQETAGILHFPGEARRWGGQIRGRLDGDEAWDATRRFEARRGNR